MADYVNFSDFLGLNEGAADEMGGALDTEGARLQQEAQAATNARGATVNKGYGAYEASAADERKALTSYASFAQAMKDPAERMARLSKLSGGRVSSLDDALMGSRRDFGAHERNATDQQTIANNAAGRNEGRARMADDYRAAYEKQDSEFEASQQARRDAKERDRLGREYALSEFDDDTRNTGFGGMGESTAAMSRRDRELALNRLTRGPNSKVWTRPDGSTNWDIYHAQRGIQRAGHAATEANARKQDYVAQAVSPAPQAARAQSWGDYYKQNKRK